VIIQVFEPRHEKRPDLITEHRPARHPLIVITPAVMVRAVQSRRREEPFEPEENTLVAFVHPQSDLRLAAVAAEAPFAGEESEHVALAELVQSLSVVHREFSIASHDGKVARCCFTVKCNVKHFVVSPSSCT